MRVFTAVIAIAIGILVLLGYFLPQAELIQTILLNWAVILVGVAALVGLVNLLVVHTDKVRRGEKGSIYSALLVLVMAITFFAGAVLRPEHAAMQVVLNGIILPVEAALMGLLTVSLLYAAIRLLRRRADVMGIVFILTAAVLFFGSVTLPFGEIPIIGTLVRPWVSQVLALGGARGILIGVALGTLATGLRVLFGMDPSVWG
ncbi:MAG: hypothetical protein HND47_04500 [Chloroflexi bacterium]|nr:hypothetical protein [Chloroflexota bacterium]